MWDEPPLLGREFMHGISDCYSLVRDYYWQEKEMILPIYPRSIGWQDRGEDLLSTNEFMRCGFERVLHNDIERGDIILFKIHSKLNNHCGVYVGNDLLLASSAKQAVKARTDKPLVENGRFLLAAHRTDGKGALGVWIGTKP